MPLLRCKLPNIATYITPGYQYVGNVRHRVAHTPRWSKSQPTSKAASAKRRGSQDKFWARLDELEREEALEQEEESEAAPTGGPSSGGAVSAGDGQHLEDSQPLTQRITFQHTRGGDAVAEDVDSKQVMPLYLHGVSCVRSASYKP